MFRLYLTLAYIIPNIYVFTRINQLFIGKGYKIWYSLIYLVLFIIYPIAGYYRGHDTSLVMNILSLFSGYLLPFYLYLFLAVLLFDLFLLFNLIFKFISKEKRRSFSFRLYTFSAMILISVLVVTGGAINLNTIRVSEYHAVLPKRNSEIENLRIAFVSDIHIQQSTRIQYIEKFVSKVNKLNPDIMLFGGDIVEGDGENETSEAIESTFRKINSKYGSFGVVGNHEFYGGQQNGSFFRKAGITMLYDTIINIDNSFYLAGRYDEHFRKRKNIGELLEDFKPGLPFILMDHRPTHLQEVGRTQVDAQFSGHTHNGQLFPINYIIHQIYELSWGHRKIGNTNFFVSSGLRLWGPPVKTAGKSEIMVVDFKFE
jgi:predicted MPP superfamily phosphohydrolase